MYYSVASVGTYALNLIHNTHVRLYAEYTKYTNKIG